MLWNNYRLIEQVAKESDLLTAYAKAIINKKKKQYKRGEAILFWTHYRGELTNGFFSNQVFSPERKTFSDGTNRVSSWAPDTLESGDPNIAGKLNGYVTHVSQWSWNIPLDAPLGQYRIYMRVHNHFRADSRPVVYESEDSFLVVSDKSESPSNHREGEREASFNQTEIELLKALYFFPEHWMTYKELIKKNELISPQNGEIKWCSDQIKSSITRARMLNLDEINAIIRQIEEVSNDMALFGIGVQKFPHNLAFQYGGDGKEVILDIITRGDKLLKKVKKTISLVEQAFR
jgi:hypothetical protein